MNENEEEGGRRSLDIGRFRSLILEFLHWWGDELRGMIPARLLAALHGRRRYVELHLGEDGVVRVESENGNARPLSDEAANLSAGKRQSNCRIWLPPVSVLAKRLTLPAAAEGKLPEVLRFQIDQETPFQADDVLFDFRIHSRDRRTRRLVVDWRLVPRRLVDEARQAAVAYGLTTTSIGIAGDANRYEFLDAGAKPRRSGNFSLRWASAAAFGCLVVAAVAMPLVRKQMVLVELDRDLAAARQVAERSAALRQQVVALRGTQGYVTDLRLARATISALLAETTAVVPDGAWLTRLTIKDREMTIAGMSPASSSLVGRIEAHPHFEQVAYRSPTMRQPDSGLEVFDLGFRLTGVAR